MKRIKIILSTVFMAVLFSIFSFSAFADPLTAAFAGSAAASGFTFTGITGFSSASIDGVLKGSYSDPVSWDSIYASDSAYASIKHNSSDNSKVDIRLSPAIATAGYNRLDQVNSFYNLSPGTFHNFGNVTCVGSYALTNNVGASSYGPPVAILSGTSSFHPVVTPQIYLDVSYLSSGTSGGQPFDEFKGVDAHIGSYTGSASYSLYSLASDPYYLVFGSTGSGRYGFLYCKSSQYGTNSVTTYIAGNTPSSTGITPVVQTPLFARSADSSIVDPAGLENVVTLPSSYVQNIVYVDGEIIDTESLLLDILDAITSAYSNDEIDDSVYLPPPGPVNPDQPSDVPDIGGALGGIQDSLNDLIGTQTDISDHVGDISDALDGVQTGVDSISDALEGVGENIGSITDALDVPTTSEASQLMLPDLRTLFPFCIPFDIYNIITAFNASPVAPRAQIPFNISAIGLQYTFDIDLSSFDSVAQIVRTLEFVAYAVGLAILTSKVIRW